MTVHPQYFWACLRDVFNKLMIRLRAWVAAAPPDSSAVCHPLSCCQAASARGRELRLFRVQHLPRHCPQSPASLSYQRNPTALTWCNFLPRALDAKPLESHQGLVCECSAHWGPGHYTATETPVLCGVSLLPCLRRSCRPARRQAWGRWRVKASSPLQNGASVKASPWVQDVWCLCD